MAAGAVVGGLAGLVLFRSGSGYRSASVAAGIGTALGSTYERIAGYHQNGDLAAASAAAKK